MMSRIFEVLVVVVLFCDIKLFERVVFFMYCVCFFYRKDVGDVEIIFVEVRERICMFKSGVMDVEDVDEVEREEDFESDVGDELEVDLNFKKEDFDVLEEIGKLIGGVEFLLENGKLKIESEVNFFIFFFLEEFIKDEKIDDILLD